MKKAVLLILLTCLEIASAQSYKVSKKINVTGDEGWDYLSVDNINQLALTFPFNIILGLPLYLSIIDRLWK